MAKKALLIGCNYPGKKNIELRGCVNDVERTRRCLVEQYGFLEEDITVLIDTDQKYTQPTGENIRTELSRLVKSAMPGDVLFVHFSGHGYRKNIKKSEYDDTGYTECIVPTDLNLVTDGEFKEFVESLPIDCKITIVADSCHSGGLIKGATEQIGNSTKLGGRISREFNIFGFDFEPSNDDVDYCYLKVRSLDTSTLIDILKEESGRDDINEENLTSSLVDIFGEHASPKFVKPPAMISDGISGLASLQVGDAGTTETGLLDSGILLSACQSEQKAYETIFKGSGKIYGAFSNYIQVILMETQDDASVTITNKDLVMKARKKLKENKFEQRPGLYCSGHHTHARFIAC